MPAPSCCKRCTHATKLTISVLLAVYQFLFGTFGTCLFVVIFNTIIMLCCGIQFLKLLLLFAIVHSLVNYVVVEIRMGTKCSSDCWVLHCTEGASRSCAYHCYSSFYILRKLEYQISTVLTNSPVFLYTKHQLFMLFFSLKAVLRT